MKAILEFQLPDDEYEYNLTRDAWRFKSVLIDMDNWLRQKTKYSEDELSDDEHKAYYECRNKLNELISEENINLYD
jgi:hypothetical protein